MTSFVEVWLLASNHYFTDLILIIWAGNNTSTLCISGGDDVQQLCEAGEEEFLEIMALVGMASKPLHVRRLQKALQEWVANPGKVCSGRRM